MPELKNPSPEDLDDMASVLFKMLLHEDDGAELLDKIKENPEAYQAFQEHCQNEKDGLNFDSLKAYAAGQAVLEGIDPAAVVASIKTTKGDEGVQIDPLNDVDAFNDRVQKLQDDIDEQYDAEEGYKP